MKKTIEVVVSPSGDIAIEGIGFKGAECEKATKFLEEALGLVAGKVKKPEYHQQNVNHGLQKVGR